MGEGGIKNGQKNSNVLYGRPQSWYIENQCLLLKYTFSFYGLQFCIGQAQKKGSTMRWQGSNTFKTDFYAYGTPALVGCGKVRQENGC